MATVLFNSSHHGSQQQVQVGETIEIQLTQRPTGYLWGNATLSNDNVVFLSKRTVSPPGQAPGASMTIGFLFEARRAGSTTIEFICQRPWEQTTAGGGAQPPSNAHSFRLTLQIRSPSAASSAGPCSAEAT